MVMMLRQIEVLNLLCKLSIFTNYDREWVMFAIKKTNTLIMASKISHLHGFESIALMIICLMVP